MNTKLTVAVAFAAGLLGGSLIRFIAPPVAFAQDQATVPQNIRSQSITLVDASNNPVGTFKAEPFSGSAYPPAAGKNAPKMRIVLRDSSGCAIWSAGGISMLEPVCSR